MDNQELIQVEGVSKKYCRNFKRSIYYGMEDIFRDTLGLRPSNDALRKDEFMAVDDISFSVRRGECVGLIGDNGSGKSTILKIINGIILPNRGKVTVRGRVGALLEVGAGFHPMLTGRENIYVSGSILGLSKREIDQKQKSIIEFAELNQFIDTPVKFYSSGMHVRLAFAVAAHMQPDVLLLDEVLAVGDVGFRAKCINAITSLMDEAAVIFVSHNLAEISRISSRVLVLNKGSVVANEVDNAKAISLYNNMQRQQKGYIAGSGRAKISSIQVNGRASGAGDQIQVLSQGRVTVRFSLSMDREIEDPVIFVCFLKQDMQVITQSSTLWSDLHLDNSGEALSVNANFVNLFLNPDTYYLLITVLDQDQREILVQDYATVNFRVVGKYVGGAAIQLFPDWGISRISDTR